MCQLTQFIRSDMPARTKLTTKEIAEIVADYRTAFPEWQTARGDTLVRVNGAVGQAIWFDRLRTGAYRPTCRIHVLAAPDEGGGTVVLPQFLGIKNKEILAAIHARVLPAVILALKSEIAPSISKPLDPAHVAELLGARAGGRPANAYALACLYAALDRGVEATRWITEYYKAVRALELPEQPIDRSRAAFLDEVASWIAKSDSGVHMSNVLEQEKSKLLGA
jgi:hypothetical protein